MKNLKKLATALTLTGIIIIGVTNANAGLMMSDFTTRDNQPQTCSERSEQVDRGIIFEFTGIIFELVGLDTKDKETKDIERRDTNTDCGIIFG